MAFKATVELASSKYDALNCGYSFHRSIDAKGRPSSNVFGGTVSIVVESNNDTDIIAQLMDQFKPFSGNITFHKGGDPLVMKKLSWENGYIMSYRETFDMTSRQPMQIHIEISAEKLKMGGENIEHKRPK